MPDFLPGRSQRVRELCKKLKPIIGPRMDQLYLAYCSEDEDGKEQIEVYLEVLAGKYLSGSLDDTLVDLVPPSLDQAAGPYVLGTVRYAGKDLYPFGLREGEWIQHVGIFGRSGAGKTNLGFEVFRQLLLHGKPVLAFDWKRNYRDLLILPEFHDVEVYTVGRDVVPFRFNPLIPPPGTDAKTWLKNVIEVVAQAYCLGNGVLFLLQESLNTVYEEAGVYSGTVKEWPTFRDVLRVARERNARGRESAWLSSTLRALSMLCFGEMDKMLNTPENQGHTIDRILNQSTILELESLSQSDKTFFTSALLLYIHHRRMADGQREHFRHACIIEEAHHLLSDQRTSLVGGQSVMDITFREIREFGESIIILDQHPSQISISALGNTYCTIALNLKHQKDVNAMGQTMLLDSSDRDILGNLEVGQAVVKLQGRATHPFLINIPEFTIFKGSVSDNAIRLRMTDRIFHTDEMRALQTPEGDTAANLHDDQSGSLSVASAVASVPLSLDGTAPAVSYVAGRAASLEAAFLADVRDYPESGVAARYKRLGVSVRQGQKLRDSMVRTSLIEDREEYTKTGRVRVIRLTEKGRRLIETRP